MSLSTQRIIPGRLGGRYAQEFARLQNAGAIEKLWTGQASLWKSAAISTQLIADRLGWISVLDAMQNEAAALAEFAREISAARLRHVVLLGMGGSSLAPEVFSLLFSPKEPSRRFFILDTTDPAAVLRVTRDADLAHALFIVASKSGKTIETLSQLAYFHDRLSRIGVASPGERFIAITDAGSPLETFGAEQQFRRVFLNREDIGGRFSALSYFGLVPAALWDVDIPAVLSSGMEMRAACDPEAPAQSNLALALGAFLGAAGCAGEGNLYLVSSPRLASLGDWIEQLVAESTGKEGKGIAPITGASALPVDVLADGVTIALRLDGDEDSGLRSTTQALTARNAPTIEISMSDVTQLGGEFFKWEAATPIAAAALAVEPFDEPNVQESKDNTARMLEQFQAQGALPIGAPRVIESGIELYFGEPRSQTSPNLLISEALHAFFSARRPQDYLSLLAFVDRQSTNERALEALRTRLSDCLRMPVLLGYGPRYLHSIGQLYKGGPATGMFLIITARPVQDVSVPGAKYTFGQLQMAQALGDLRSLSRRRKPHLHLHLGQGAPAGWSGLQKIVEDALEAVQRASI
jgi:glucose-6-phosphate isomerase